MVPFEWWIAGSHRGGHIVTGVVWELMVATCLDRREEPPWGDIYKAQPWGFIH